MKKIKILHISSNIHPGINKHNYLEKITNDWYSWEALRLKKIYPELDIECWTFENAFKKEFEIIHKKIKFRVFPSNINFRHSMGISSSMISALKKEEKTAMNNNISLILHIHEYHCWQSLLILLFMNKHTKIISQHHGARAPFKNLMKYKRLFLIFPYILFMQILENSLLKKINIFYALTDEEIEYLRKRCKNSEIKFQTAGIDNFYFKNVDKKDARNKLCLNLNKKYVLYLGRIKSSKGMKELIDAMEYFKDKKIELLIIGEGSDLNMYKNYAKEKSINNISFLGPKYGMEKKMFLSACDCLILPSYTEGAPVVLMEALASNLPAVATNIGGIPKIIRDGKDGIIIKPHSKKDIINALVRILKWTKKNLKQYTEKYKWSIIIKNTVKDYRRLIKH